MELQVTPVMPLLDTVLLPECQDSWETEGCSQPPGTDTFLGYFKGVHARNMLHQYAECFCALQSLGLLGCCAVGCANTYTSMPSVLVM